MKRSRRIISRAVLCLVLFLALLVPTMGTGCAEPTRSVESKQDQEQVVVSECDLCGSRVEHYVTDTVTRPTLCTDDGQDICIWAVVR